MYEESYRMHYVFQNQRFSIQTKNRWWIWCKTELNFQKFISIRHMDDKETIKIIFSRVESQIASSPRHEMQVTVRVGANKNGKIRAIDVYTLSNTGAYGEHGPTTVGLSGHKSIPLYRDLEAFKFAYDVVYTNRMSAGAYRGYGATQGCLHWNPQ